MGLINLYNAMSMVPHIPYRFKAEIWPNHDGQYIPNANNMGIEFAVKRISQPTFKMNTENKKVFGNTAHVVPILKFGETTMEITFEENDDMLVFKTLAGYMGNELYTGIPGGLINIRITQFDNSMNIIVDKRVYVCRLKEHGMPSFNNNGFGSPVEISATFNVIYVMEEPVVIDTTIDENGKVTVNRDKLPDNETVELELQKVVEEEGKKKKKEEEEREKFGGRRTPEMEKRTQEAKERMDKKRDELSEAIQRELVRSYLSSDMERQNQLLDAGKENFLKARANAMTLDVNSLKPEERYALEQEYKKLSTGEKLMLAHEIDLSDGLDSNEITTMQNELLNSAQSGELTENDVVDIAKNLDTLAKEYGEAHKDYETERNKTVPVGSGSNYKGDDPLLKAISVSYEAEVGKHEGERGHIFFDMIDAGGAKGTINLGSGSSEGARGFSDVGELTVNIGGVEMKFKNSASLNAAIQKAFGGKEKIIAVFEAAGGGTGDVSKEGRKKADVGKAKAGLNALLAESGGVIEDDYGNKSTVALDKGRGIYLNVQLDEESSQKVSDKNMRVDTAGWSESTKQTIIENVGDEENKTVRGMVHMEHAYSGFKDVWTQFNKNEENVRLLNEDIKNGKFSEATLAALEESVDALKKGSKTKSGFKRVIRQYGYTS